MENTLSREYTCIMCPNGCRITVQYIKKDTLKEDVSEVSGIPASSGRATVPTAPVITSLEGNLCPRGRDYVVQELTDPRRNIATSVLVTGGELPLASVRLTAPIPKDRIFDAMKEIRQISVTAPVGAGTVVIRNLLGLGVNVVVTKTVDAARAGSS